MKELTIKEFYTWLKEHKHMLMDDVSVCYTDLEDGEITILDMDDELPKSLLSVNEDNSKFILEDNGSLTALVLLKEGGKSTLEYSFKPINVLLNENNSKVHVVVINRTYENIEQITSYNDDESGNNKAESLFVELCSNYFTNWEDYSQEDIDNTLEEGSEQNNNYKVLIHHD